MKFEKIRPVIAGRALDRKNRGVQCSRTAFGPPHSASGSRVCIGAAGGLDLSRAERIRPAQDFCLRNSTWMRRHTSPLCSPQAAAYYRRTAFSSAFIVSRMLFTSSSAS